MNEIIISPIVKQADDTFKLSYQATWKSGSHTSGFVFVSTSEFETMNYEKMQYYIAQSVMKEMSALLEGISNGS